MLYRLSGSFYSISRRLLLTQLRRNRMNQSGNKLGRLEAQFFAYTQFKRKQRIRCGEIAKALGITPKQELELLSRMARNRWIARIRRGYYAVPDRLPPGGNWTPGEYWALALLMEDRKARYRGFPESPR